MKHHLLAIVEGHTLSVEDAVDAFNLIMEGHAEPAQTAALLAMLQQRGPTVSEVTGAAKVMRDKATKSSIPDGLIAVDTCGTGGDHAGTFNISTAAAIVAAGAGRPDGMCVAKHGNRSVTSSSGSSQVLETLGVKLRVQPDTQTQCLDEAGIAFLFAPAHHPAMKHAGPVRQALGFRTLFNIVGPLTNPAGATRQVMGVFNEDILDLVAEVHVNLGTEHAMIVNGTIPEDGLTHCSLDELSSVGSSSIRTVKAGEITKQTLDPTELGISHSHPAALRVDSPEQSADVINKILDGTPGPARDIVCLNAAAALVVGDVASDLADGMHRAGEAIDSGAARGALQKLVDITRADTTPA